MMNRWSALAMKGDQRVVKHPAGDLVSARLVHLTPVEAHGGQPLAKYPEYKGPSPDHIENVFRAGPSNKREEAGMYLVVCWCGQTMQEIDRKLIGKTTFSCGRVGCAEGEVLKCENCGQPLQLGVVEDLLHPKKGRGKSKRWCSSTCAVNGYKKRKEAKVDPSQWVSPPTEVEQYDREIERLLAEINELQQGEHND
jgi:hypothetical protein